MSKSQGSPTKTIKKVLNKSCYRYYNANPLGKFTDDCVIRALSIALDKTWDTVFLELNQLAFEKKIVFGDERVYSIYLANNGWFKQKQPTHDNGKKYKICEFLESFHGTAVIHAGNCHMSFVSEGHLYDIFNCEDRIIGCYWVKSCSERN